MRPLPPFAVALVGAVVVAAAACDPVADGAPPPPPQNLEGLRINEVAAAGVPFDWFELVNVGDAEVSLDDVRFSDDAGSVAKGRFPQGAVVGPGEFAVFEVSDEGVGFKLGSDEELHVFADNGAVIDTVDWDEGESPLGGSLARVPDGTGEFATAVADTRGASNGG